jgi:hypothetical protein
MGPKVLKCMVLIKRGSVGNSERNRERNGRRDKRAAAYSYRKRRTEREREEGYFFCSGVTHQAA